jgi:ribosomal protein S18 acetylase RimI-like enzyme
MSSAVEPFTIRPATIDDADAIDILIDEFRSYLRGIGDLDAFTNFGSEQYRRDGFGTNPAFQGLVASRGNEVLGYALYAREYNTDTGSPNLYLHDLFVSASYRGQGVGKALMKRLVDICRGAGGTAINWHVWHTNESAIKFYERIGARSCETIRLMRLEGG